MVRGGTEKQFIMCENRGDMNLSEIPTGSKRLWFDDKNYAIR